MQRGNDSIFYFLKLEKYLNWEDWKRLQGKTLRSKLQGIDGTYSTFVSVFKIT